ncbi:hypothetical protein ASF62_07345 [Leifsonia sp. Leaf325]|nr:hypothetical protein [Leifsonia sp. Leaf325]KQQ93976.1 hypothetical protein ASF62_07345 [Leifsonia sp. Leaf325]
MSELLPAVRPRGRHANPDVAVDAPSASSVAPAAASEPVTLVAPVAEPGALAVPPAEPVTLVAPVAEPDSLVAPVAEPVTLVAMPVEPDVVAMPETVQPERTEPHDSEADADSDHAEVTDAIEAELIDDVPAPPEVEADEFADEPTDGEATDGEATVVETVAVPDAAREEPASVVAADLVAEPAQPAPSAWAPPPWEAPAASVSEPAAEASAAPAGTAVTPPIDSSDAPGPSSFAPPVATAVLDGPPPAMAALPAPVPAVSGTPSPVFFGLAPTPAVGAAADVETTTLVADPITAPSADAPIDEPVEPADAIAAPTDAQRRRRGRVARGVLLSLLIIPVGIAAWVLLWSYGFITSVLAFGISWGAVGLYRLGSRARVTTGAFWALTGVILATLALAFVGAIAADVIATMGLDPLVAATSSEFWSAFLSALSTAELWRTYAINLAVAVLFAGLGLFSVLKSLRPESRA